MEIRFLRSCFAVSFNFSFILLAAVTFLISAGGCGFGPGGKQPAIESIIKMEKNFLSESKLVVFATVKN